MKSLFRRLFATKTPAERLTELWDEAVAAGERKQHSKQLAAIDKALEIAAALYGPDNYMVNVLYQNARAEALYWLKQYAAARTAADVSLKRNPSDISMLKLRAQVLLELKDHEAVLRDYTAICDLEPDKPKNLLMRAAAYIMVKNAVLASADVKNARKHPHATKETLAEADIVQGLVDDFIREQRTS